MNITQAIAATAQRQPQALAIQRGRNRMSFAELDAAVARLAGRLAAGGVSRGDLAGIFMPSSPLHFLTILALAHLGAVSLSLPLVLPATALREMARRFGVKLVLGSRPDHGLEGVPRLIIERGWQNATNPASAPPARVAGDAPWRLALSSGTTGTMKGILFRHGDTIEFAQRLDKVAPPAGAGTRMLCFRGLETGFALRPCLRQLLSGGALVYAASTKPQAMVDAFRDDRVTHAALSPPLVRAMYEMLGDGGPHFRALTHLAVSGAALSPEIFDLAQARITPHVYSQYGATEAGLVAIADPGLLREHPDCAGRLVPWLEAQAVDENERARAAGETGALRFRGPGVAAEYYRDPAATARSFRDGWFYPGDHGRIGAGKLLYLEGRSDDRMNLGGRKIDPAQIERVIQSHPQVVEAAVFAGRAASGEDLLCAAVVLRGRLEARILGEHCRAALGASRTPVRFIGVPKLPRNENGKLLRRELPRLAGARTRAAAGDDVAE